MMVSLPRQSGSMRANASAMESGEKCEQIVVILSEFMPRADLIKRLSEIILDWCQKKGIDTILTLEGVNTSDRPEESKIFGVGTTSRDQEDAPDIPDIGNEGGHGVRHIRSPAVGRGPPEHRRDVPARPGQGGHARCQGGGDGSSR